MQLLTALDSIVLLDPLTRLALTNLDILRCREHIMPLTHYFHQMLCRDRPPQPCSGQHVLVSNAQSRIVLYEADAVTTSETPGCVLPQRSPTMLGFPATLVHVGRRR